MKTVSLRNRTINEREFKINNEEVVIGVTGAYLIDHSMPVYTLEIVNISD